MSQELVKNKENSEAGSGIYLRAGFRRYSPIPAIALRVAEKIFARGVKALVRITNTLGALCLANQRFFTRNATSNNVRTVPRSYIV